MFEEINSKALAAQGGDPGAVRELLEALFAEPLMSRLDRRTAASLKERIVNAELIAQTVSVEQITGAFNWLMDALAAPPYARTSERQIRSLQNMSRHFLPNIFNGEKGAKIGPSETGSGIEGMLTPVQAAILTILMIQQKVLNRDFQKEPARWELEYELASPDSPKQKDERETNSRLVSRPAASEMIEMHRIIYETYYSPADQVEIAHGVLNRLGLKVTPEREL